MSDSIEAASSPRVTLIILTYNGRRFISALLESIESQTYKNVETIVVDNASTDGTKQVLLDRLPRENVIVNQSNEGCAVGFNIGAGVAQKSDILCFLNQDIVLDKNYCAVMVRRFQSDSAIGAIQPLVYFLHDPTMVENCGHTVDKWMSTKTVGHCALAVPAPPEGLMFTLTAPAVKRTTFERLGGFDRSLFIYYEDTDLCLRLWKASERVVFDRDAVVYHAQAATAGHESSAWHLFLYARNRVRLLWKHAGDGWDWSRVVSATVGGITIGLLLMLLHWRDGAAVLRGVIWNMIHWRDNECARQSVRNTSVLSTRALLEQKVLAPSAGPLSVIPRAFRL